jgi:hypothetical protein
MQNARHNYSKQHNGRKGARRIRSDGVYRCRSEMLLRGGESSITGQRAGGIDKHASVWRR